MPLAREDLDSNCVSSVYKALRAHSLEVATLVNMEGVADMVEL
jgi:hypothetical protein